MRWTAVVVLVLVLCCKHSFCWLQRHASLQPTHATALQLQGTSGRSSTRVRKEEAPAPLDMLTMAQSTFDKLKTAVGAFETMMSQRVPEQRQMRKRKLLGRRGTFPSRQSERKMEHPGHKHVDLMMEAKRKELPVFKHRDELIRTIQANPVTVVVGPTGSGKSTQVPQYLLESPLVDGRDERRGRIICTQPRRLAASSLAARVTTERGQVGGESVGYMMSRENNVSPDTELVFMTQGVLLRMLEDNPTLDGIDYVIVDEVHERSLETDFLLPILRNLVQKRKNFHLVIMSATMHAEDFIRYFGTCPVVSIEGRTFPVEQFYFEDILRATKIGKPAKKIPARSARKGMSNDAMAKVEANVEFLEDNLPYSIMQKLIEHVHKTEGDGAILLFLPGLPEIEVMRDVLQRSALMPQFKLHVLHSAVPIEDQRLVYAPPPEGQRKVILSTNIAESSVTINDAVFVIDSGKRKAVGIDEKTKAASLEMQWVSQASATQRAGRAGRVQPGKCWHMIPLAKWQVLPAYDTPVISRTPLEEVCLKVRALRVAPKGVNGTAAFLATLMSPPAHDVVEHAVSYLKDMGAFTQDEQLTELGQCMASLPLHPNLARAVLYGLMFKCLDPIVTLVTFIHERSPFVMPFSARSTSRAAQKLLAEDEPSDHFAMWNAFLQYKEALKERNVMEFCWQHFVAPSRMRISAAKTQLVRTLSDIHLIDPKSNLTNENANSHNWPVVKAALLAGLYPSVAQVRPNNRGSTVRSQLFRRGLISPTSMNYDRTEWPHHWVMYSRHSIYEGTHSVSGVTDMAPLPLMLLGNISSVAQSLPVSNPPNARTKNQRVMALNDLIRVETTLPLAQLVQRTRKSLFQCLQLLVSRDPTLNAATTTKFMDTVCAAMAESDSAHTPQAEQKTTTQQQAKQKGKQTREYLEGATGGPRDQLLAGTGDILDTRIAHGMAATADPYLATSAQATHRDGRG